MPIQRRLAFLQYRYLKRGACMRCASVVQFKFFGLLLTKVQTTSLVTGWIETAQIIVQILSATTTGSACTWSRTKFCFCPSIDLNTASCMMDGWMYSILQQRAWCSDIWGFLRPQRPPGSKKYFVASTSIFRLSSIPWTNFVTKLFLGLFHPPRPLGVQPPK